MLEEVNGESVVKFVFQFGYGDEERGSRDSYFFFFLSWRDFSVFTGIVEGTR